VRGVALVSSIDIGSPSGSMLMVSSALAEIPSPFWSSSSGMKRGNPLLLVVLPSPAAVSSPFCASASCVALRTKLDRAESNLSVSATYGPQRGS